MSIYTTLEFFRTKQTIESFHTKYPKSLTSLKDAIREALDKIDDMVKELTRNYLGGSHNMERYIREKMISISYLLNEIQMPGIYRKFDYEYVCDMTGSANGMSEHIDKVKKVLHDLNEYIPTGFTPIVDIFEKILSCMEKYLRSFCTISLTESTSEYMESVMTYENQKRDICEEVKKNLKQIFQLGNTFHSHELNIVQLSDHSQHLARCTNAIEVPSLLLFSENCYFIQECRNLLESWMRLDQEYPYSVRNDIEALNHKKTEVEIRRRINFENFIKQRRKFDQSRQDYENQLKKEEFMEKKVRSTENDHTALILDVKHGEIELETLSIPIEGLKKQMQELETTSDMRINLNRYIGKQEAVKIRMKDNLIKLEQIEARLERYSKYFEELKKDKKYMEKMEQEMKEAQKVFENTDIELESINRYITQLRAILTLKTSNVTLKKIFYNLDLKNRLNDTTEFPSEKDPNFHIENLSEAIILTGNDIGKDWKKLYYNLPFHPPRGLSEKERDIIRFNKEQVRGLPVDMAFQSLTFWRRLHTRANITCLVESLENINRLDIVNKIGRPSEAMPQKLIRRSVEERPAQKSAITRFILKHYPHLRTSSFNNSENNKRLDSIASEVSATDI